jgi:[ribosomal protein S18]-alanine N-acetyltransferase
VRRGRGAGSVVSNKITIRRAEARDLDRALAMEREGFAFYPLGRRQLRYHLKNANAVFLVAERGGEVVGDAIGLVRRHGAAVSGRVYSLVVDGRQRKMGIGGKLFAAVVGELEKRGARRIYLEVAEKNSGAIRIYERFGFRRVGRLADYYARGEHAIHMVYGGGGRGDTEGTKARRHGGTKGRALRGIE